MTSALFNLLFLAKFKNLNKVIEKKETIKS